jgi:hypothetical protein
MRLLGKALLGSAFAVCVALACTYAPDFDDGTLHCSSDGRCPQGYTCRNTTCWRVGGSAGATGTAGTTGAAGTGAAGVTGAAGTTAPVASIDNFPGHWLFQAGSMQTINCMDGSTDSKSLAADYVDIEKSGSAGLKGSYYCDWNLTLDASKTKTAIVAGQSCQTTGTDGTKFVWKGTKFVFTTTDGVTATLQADITTDYTPVTGPAGSCALKISGTLLWSPL